jgi:hypothetical protein
MKKLYRFDNGAKTFSAYGKDAAAIWQELTNIYGDLAVKHVIVFHSCNCNSHCKQRDAMCDCDCHKMQ